MFDLTVQQVKDRNAVDLLLESGRTFAGTGNSCFGLSVNLISELRLRTSGAAADTALRSTIPGAQLGIQKFNLEKNVI